MTTESAMSGETFSEEPAQEVDTVEEVEAIEEPESLSIRETIEKAYEETESQEDDDLQGDEGEKPQTQNAKEQERDPQTGKFKPKQERKGKQGAKKKTVEGADLDAPNVKESEKLEPPTSWKVDKKEWFNKQPREVQEEVSRRWKEIEGHTTKVWQDLQREKTRHAEVNQVVDQYMPKLGMKGVSPGAAVRQLFAAHEYLMRSPVEALGDLVTDLNVDVGQLAEYLQSGKVQPKQNGSQQNQGLTITPETLQTQIQQGVQSTLQAQIAQQQQQAGAQQILAVKNQVDANGSYLYPELHDDNYLMTRVKPLVESLGKSQPTLPVSEMVKRAVHTLRVMDGKANGTPSPNGQRLQTNNSNDIAKARAASVSVKGRGKPGIPNISTQPRPGESVRETIERAYSSLYDQY